MRHSSFEVSLPDLNATRELARRVASLVSVPMTIALRGTLGAGKTQFVRYFAAALGVAEQDVTSPTYVLLQRHIGTQTIYHFDFYRLEHAEQVWDLGIDELFELPAVVLIEWSEKFPECLPDERLEIAITIDDSQQRTARVSATGVRAERLVAQLEL